MLTPEERASELTKWVAADLRPRQWTAIRDSFREALAEERAACIEAAQTAIMSFSDGAAHLESLATRVTEAIRTREESPSA